MKKNGNFVKNSSENDIALVLSLAQYKCTFRK